MRWIVTTTRNAARLLEIDISRYLVSKVKDRIHAVHLLADNHPRIIGRVDTVDKCGQPYDTFGIYQFALTLCPVGVDTVSASFLVADNRFEANDDAIVIIDSLCKRMDMQASIRKSLEVCGRNGQCPIFCDKLDSVTNTLDGTHTLEQALTESKHLELIHDTTSKNSVAPFATPI